MVCVILKITTIQTTTTTTTTTTTKKKNENENGKEYVPFFFFPKDQYW